MRYGLLITAALLAPLPALAAKWNVDSKTSSITFTAEQSGENFSGNFPSYTAHVTLDPAKPEGTNIHIAIDIAAVQVQGEDRQVELPGKEWLDAKAFPKAEFTSTKVAKQPDGSFIANGTLAIKDVKKEIAVPFTLKETGNTALAEGSFTINRTDYHVGTGDWVKDDWVKFPVNVSFALNASK